jgi:hypothetical protein
MIIIRHKDSGAIVAIFQYIEDINYLKALNNMFGGYNIEIR